MKTQFGVGTDRLPAATLDEVRTAPGVARAEGFVQGYSQLVKPNGKALGGQGAPTFGQGWIDDARLNPLKVVTGHAPTTADEIAIDKNSLDIGKFHVGDTVKVLSPSPVKTYKIVGVVRFGTADSPAGASIIAFTPAEAARVFKTGGAYDAISIVAQPGVTQEQLKTNVAKLVATDKIEVLTGAEIAKKTQSDIKDQLKGFNIVLIGFSGVALFVGSFIIYNTFSILVAQRTREMALLRALGAGRGQVVRSVLGEALIVGIVASLLGIGFGLLTALGLESRVRPPRLLAPGRKPRARGPHRHRHAHRRHLRDARVRALPRDQGFAGASGGRDARCRDRPLGNVARAGRHRTHPVRARAWWSSWLGSRPREHPPPKPSASARS